MNAMRLAVATLTVAALMEPAQAAEPPEPVVLRGHTKAVSVLAWSADGNSLATAGGDRTIRVWDRANGREVAALTEIAKAGPGGVVVAFTEDLKAAAINDRGEITIRNVADGQVLAKIDALLDRGQESTWRPDVFALAFRPDGKRLATAGTAAKPGLPAGIVIIWDVETGKIIHRFDKLPTGAGALAWSKDGKRLAAGTAGVGGEVPAAGEVRVWDAETGEALHTFRVKSEVKPGENVSAGDVAFSADGKRIAASVTAGSRATPAGLMVADSDASVRVWDLESGTSSEPVKGLKAEGERLEIPSTGQLAGGRFLVAPDGLQLVVRLAFHPDGNRLATAGFDKVVRVWDPGTGKELAALPCPDRVDLVAFSPDGQSLAAGSQDGSVRIWAVAAAPQTLRLKARIGSTTLVGYIYSGPPPWPSGNCFELTTDDKRSDAPSFTVVNMHTENFERVVKLLGLDTVEVLVLDDRSCLVTDARIPREWLRAAPCDHCTPADLRERLRASHADRFRGK